MTPTSFKGADDYRNIRRLKRKQQRNMLQQLHRYMARTGTLAADAAMRACAESADTSLVGSGHLSSSQAAEDQHLQAQQGFGGRGLSWLTGWLHCERRAPAAPIINAPEVANDPMGSGDQGMGQVATPRRLNGGTPRAGALDRSLHLPGAFFRDAGAGPRGQMLGAEDQPDLPSVLLWASSLVAVIVLASFGLFVLAFCATPGPDVEDVAALNATFGEVTNHNGIGNWLSILGDSKSSVSSVEEVLEGADAERSAKLRMRLIFVVCFSFVSGMGASVVHPLHSALLCGL
mmetsp:Transcript_42896/g.77941  ORF Transcript_42896/g.77941 Transcript_42896/m.77941 type:complete len:289 (-) Transcript_42896:47-913(-)